jgi:SAM-dependent methyltransferase
MSTPDAEKMPGRVAGKEIYGLGKVPGVTQVLARRGAASHAAFFTPHLRAGMRLLDCGCGPGSITCDLAEIVAPAEVVGIDFDPKQVEAAVAYAAQKGVSNARFQTANVYALPFPDGSFDAVFSHALVDHLSEPLKAIREMRRVLRTGGLLGVRGPDLDGHISSPPNSVVVEFFRLFGQMYVLNGEDLRVGKHLRGLFHQAGCVRVVASASYECHGTPEELWQLVGGRGGRATFLAPDGPLVRAGLVSPERAAEMFVALQAWAEDPAAFLARRWCEAVGWAE